LALTVYLSDANLFSLKIHDIQFVVFVTVVFMTKHIFMTAYATSVDECMLNFSEMADDM